MVFIAGGVGDRHRADKHLAGGERADQADAHFPVKPQRPNRRLDHVAESTGEAVAELGGGDCLVDSTCPVADVGIDDVRW